MTGALQARDLHFRSAQTGRRSGVESLSPPHQLRHQLRRRRSPGVWPRASVSLPVVHQGRSDAALAGQKRDTHRSPSVRAANAGVLQGSFEVARARCSARRARYVRQAQAAVAIRTVRKIHLNMGVRYPRARGSTHADPLAEPRSTCTSRLDDVVGLRAPARLRAPQEICRQGMFAHRYEQRRSSG